VSWWLKIKNKRNDEMNKVHVIVNPFSARGKTGKRWTVIKEVINHYFKEFKYIFTEKPRQATEIARDLLKQGFDLIIGVGGDGTLNEITNGYFHKNTHQTINGEASLGIIPSGTGSDFIRFMRIPKEFNRSVALIKNSGIRKIDVGKITYKSSQMEEVSRYFINVASFGLGAEVVKNLSAIPAGKRGPLSYYMGMLSTIRTYKSKRVKVVVDDSEEISDRFLIGAVANGRIFGGGMMIAPEAEADDGYFDLVLARDMKKLEIVKNSRLLYTGRISKHPKVIVKKVRNIKVYPAEDVNEEVNIEYDGEVGETIPVEFQIIERHVNFRI
jgi:diacylglycerol kinase (ATP)